MEEPGRLHDMFDAFDSESSDPGMEWSEMGPIINAALDKKEKKKRRGFIYWILGSVLLIAALTYFMIDAGSKIETLNNLASQNQKQQIKQKEASPLAPSKINRQEIVHNNHISKEERTTPTLHLQNRSLKTENTHSPDSRINKAESLSFSSNMAKAQRRNQTVPSDETPTKQKLLTDDAATSQADPLPERITSRTMQYDYLIRMGLDKLHYSRSIDVVPNIIQFPKIDEELEKQNRLTVLAYSGVTNNDLHTDYSSTTSLSGVSMDVAIQKILHRNFFIELGTSIDQQRFQTAFEDTTAIKLYRPNTPDTIFYYGSVEEIIYTDSISGLGIRSFGNTNKVTTLSIPVSMGYRAQFGSLSVGTQVGLGFDLYQKVDFRTADALFDVQSRSSSTQFSFTPKFFGILSVEYDISNHLSLGGRYRISRQTVHPWQDSEKRSFTAQGIQVGLRLKI